MSHGDADVPSHKPVAKETAKKSTSAKSATKKPATADAVTPSNAVKPAIVKPAATRSSTAKAAPGKAKAAPGKAGTPKTAAAKSGTATSKTATTKPAATKGAASKSATTKAPATKAPATKAPATKTPARKPAATTSVSARVASTKVAPKRVATAAQNAPVTADLVTVPAIDHSPDLSLGGVDAPVALPAVDDAIIVSAAARAAEPTPAAVEPPVPLVSAVAAEALAVEAASVAEAEAASVAEAEAVVVEAEAEAVAAEAIAEAAIADAELAAVETSVASGTAVKPEAETSAAPALVPESPQPAAAPQPVGPAKPETIALQVSGLTKSFGGQHAVDAIDLTVPAGSFYGIVGPNGAGKTTTLSMIAGLLKPDEGTITVCGVDARNNTRAARRLIGVLPDRLRTFDRLTGKQLLSYFGALRGLPARTVDERVADLARAFDLTEALGRVVSDYSAGMTKKIMMAGALIHSPRVLILDEPFESVDPVSSTVILDILTAYVNNGGTVILSSHGMDLVERVCSRLAVIVAGQVLAEGTIEAVRGGVTLEQRFVELSGGVSDAEGLEWLHTYSA